MRKLLRAFLSSLAIIAVPLVSHANPLDRWQVSCKVDDGAIRKSGRDYVFMPSRNYCPGGQFGLRSEIYSNPVRPDHKGTYIFSTRLRLTAEPGHLFSIFSVHDSRLGCAPPLQVFVRPSGRLWAASDVKTGPGESCIRGQLGSGESRGRLKLDGTQQELRIMIDFDGTGGFEMALWLDDVLQLSGRYRPSSRATFVPEKYYFKHGVYGPRQFPYVLNSDGVSVRKVRRSR